MASAPTTAPSGTGKENVPPSTSVTPPLAKRRRVGSSPQKAAGSLGTTCGVNTHNITSRGAVVSQCSKSENGSGALALTKYPTVTLGTAECRPVLEEWRQSCAWSLHVVMAEGGRGRRQQNGCGVKGLAVAMRECRVPVFVSFPRVWSVEAQEDNRMMRKILKKPGTAKVLFDALFQVGDHEPPPFTPVTFRACCRFERAGALLWVTVGLMKRVNEDDEKCSCAALTSAHALP